MPGSPLRAACEGPSLPWAHDDSPNASNPATFAERLRESFEQMRSEVGSTLPGDLAPTEATIASLSWDEIAYGHRHTFASTSVMSRCVDSPASRGFRRRRC